LGNLIANNLSIPATARLIIVGFPSDEGVRRNHGRVGAAGGPCRIRHWLSRLTPDPHCHEAFLALLEHTSDLGDLKVTGDLEADQDHLGKALEPHLARGAHVLILGGGHETTYGHFLGYVAAELRVNILNWDAHADVRPLVEGHGHSGSAFAQALEHPSRSCRKYEVAGLNPSTTAKAHVDFVRKHHGNCFFCEEINGAKIHQIYHAMSGPAMVSFDLDTLAAAQAPGVSAPAVPGLSIDLWLLAAEMAGRSKSVQSMDIVELNPFYDVDDRTARLAARTAWSYISGLARRS
jgi:formiminoglutamase